MNDNKLKLIVVSTVCICAIILCTGVSYLIGKQVVGNAESSLGITENENKAEEFSAIEKVGYASVGTNIYSKPDINSEIVCVIQSEEEVILLVGQGGDWYRCLVQDKAGYINISSVKNTGEGISDEHADFLNNFSGSGFIGGFDGGVESFDDFDDPPAPPEPPTRATAAPPKTQITTVSTQQVTNYDNAALNMLAGINESRKEKGLPALSMDANLKSDALREAKAAAMSGAGATGRLANIGSAFKQGSNISMMIPEAKTKVGIAIVEGKNGFWYSIKY